MGSCLKKKQATNMLLVIVIPETINYSSHAHLKTSPWNKRSQFPVASKSLQRAQYLAVSGPHCISIHIKYTPWDLCRDIVL